MLSHMAWLAWDKLRDMSCHIRFPLTALAQMTQLNENLKLEFSIKNFYNCETQVGVAELLDNYLNNLPFILIFFSFFMWYLCGSSSENDSL